LHGRYIIIAKTLRPAYILRSRFGRDFPQTFADDLSSNRARRYNPETTDRIKQAITEGNLVLGMSAIEARASWGAPEKVNRTVSMHGVHEQWIYGNTYVYFEDGILTSWQDSR
jgi:hypothetical protein